jgi:protein-L-isoaspartate(D-aspartate) O-methyltransferase
LAQADEHETERKAMVEHQLRRRRIADERVLAAMEKVPRHRFLLSPDDHGAYGDYPLPIGEGQTISQPYMVALMTEALRLTGSERVLEIGTGSGYQAAILAELAREVYSVERFPGLAERARAVLADLGYSNVTVIVGDGSVGHPEAAPYDRIIVTAAAPQIAPPWVEQLAEGGILVVPVGDRWGQTLMRCVKRAGKVAHEDLGGCVFVPLVGEHGWQSG